MKLINLVHDMFHEINEQSAIMPKLECCLYSLVAFYNPLRYHVAVPPQLGQDLPVAGPPDQGALPAPPRRLVLAGQQRRAGLAARAYLTQRPVSCCHRLQNNTNEQDSSKQKYYST